MSTRAGRTARGMRGAKHARQDSASNGNDQHLQTEEQAPVVQEPDLPLDELDSVEVEGSATSERSGRSADQARTKDATILRYQPDHEPESADEQDLPRLMSDDRNFVWVDLSEYDPADLQRIAELLDLHHSGIQATLSSWRRPRLQIFGDTFYVTATVPEFDADEHLVTARQLDLFVGPNFLLSAHKHPLPMRKRILARAKSNPKLLEHDSVYMLSIILDELLGCYEAAHEQNAHEIEAMEERALRDTSDAFLEDLLRLKRYIFALSLLADQHRPVFVAFLRPDFPWVTANDIKEDYRDLEQHLTYLSDTLHADKDAVNSAFDIYISHDSHRTSNIMKVLTIVSTLLLPVSVLFGFFGTNVLQAVPALTGLSGFIVMIAISLLISGIAFWFLFRRGWL